MNATRWSKELGRYAPAFALAAAVALLVAFVPSKAPEQVSTSATDLFGPASDDGVVAGGDGTAGATGSTAVGGSAGGAGGTTAGGSGTTSRTGTGAGGSAGGTGGGTGGGGGSSATGPAGDCSRLKITEGVTCRPPKWSGDNGGATYAGVTANRINIVVYMPRQNEQVQALFAANGAATDAEMTDAIETFEKYFNANYETYGRYVDLIYVRGNSAVTDAAGQQADAIDVATKHKAFAVDAPSTSAAFTDELHRRGIPVFTLNQFTAKYLSDNAPHVFSMLPDLDLTNTYTAEYLCKRVLGRKAVHAGDAEFRNAERRLGIIYPSETDAGPDLKRRVEACGGTVTSIQGYSSDVATANQQATTLMAALSSADVSTVTCVCDPIAPAYFTAQATKQGYFPEWIHNGILLTDHIAFGRLYDQTQWRRSFGISVLSTPELLSQTAPNKAYKAVKPNGTMKGGIQFWVATLFTFDAIESAGPRLTDRSFAQAVYTRPPQGGQGIVNRYSFGNNGPGPYSAVDTVMEIWWSADRTARDGRPGTPFYVNGGKRYLLGEFPRTDPVVFHDDGSPQPVRDPDCANAGNC